MNDQSERQAEPNEPPTAETMLAYSRGTLPPAEAARVWEQLQQYPELARAYTDPFPAAGAEEGDPEYVSEEEIGRRWASFSKEIERERGGRVIPFPRIVSAIAAALIVVLGSLLWQSQLQVRRLRSELEAPHILREVVLSEDGTFRGGGPARQTVSGKALKLVLVTNADHHERYEAELVDTAASPARALWKKEVQRSEEDEFEITLLSIEPGRYEIVLHGISGAKSERLGAYSFDVAR